MAVQKEAGKSKRDLVEMLSKDEAAMLESFLASFYNIIKAKYGLEEQELVAELRDKIDEANSIPCSIFTHRLGILEAIVKFLRENRLLDFKDIGELLHRSASNVAVSYKKAAKKVPAAFENLDYSYTVPLSIFNANFTCFESLCLYLREKGMSYHEIAVVLDRDDRTIWTIHQRAMRKHGK